MRQIFSHRRLILLSCLIISTIFVGCTTLPPPVKTTPPFSGLMGARWGISVDDTKKVIETEGKKVFEDRTNRPPYTLYASGAYLNSPAIFSYFFTPKSKKLYRVDVTFKDIGIYQRVKEDLIKEFKAPDYSQPGVDHWSWTERSLVIFQREPDCIQISYSGGGMLKLNYQEGNGALR
ncbi:MAG: hypothetical protein Q8N71_01090 [candidate division Zixibacteria bacterium]|nr:hypothetical protein [candidate division Zixibacteria bacterium]